MNMTQVIENKWNTVFPNTMKQSGSGLIDHIVATVKKKTVG